MPSPYNQQCIDLLYSIAYSGKRFIPKRSLAYLKDKYPDLYGYIVDNTSETSIPTIVSLLSLDWVVPSCSECCSPVIIRGLDIKSVCSNRCAIKSKAVQDKTKATCDDRYGKRFNCERGPYVLGDHHLHKHLLNTDDVSSPEIMGKLKDSGDWRVVAKHFGLTLNSHSSAYKFMRAHGYDLEYDSTSVLEKSVRAFAESLGVTIICNDRSLISPYEIDIYIPSHNLAIEVDGLYYHSAGSKTEESPNKHLLKTEMCNSKGVQLLHIFENEWLDQPEKWKSVIRNKLGMSERIYARKTKLVTITKSEANLFCEANHLQGKCNASKVKGLMYNGELVMVATLSKSRYNKTCDQELIRLCSKLNTVVVGGASKLLKGEEYVTYANRRWSNGGVYTAIGLTLSHITAPCYWYIEKGNVYHRSSFMKHKLQARLKVFDPNLSESQNCYANKIRRIWDCGNYVYIKRNGEIV